MDKKFSDSYRERKSQPHPETILADYKKATLVDTSIYPKLADWGFHIKQDNNGLYLTGIEFNHELPYFMIGWKAENLTEEIVELILEAINQPESDPEDQAVAWADKKVKLSKEAMHHDLFFAEDEDLRYLEACYFRSKTLDVRNGDVTLAEAEKIPKIINSLRTLIEERINVIRLESIDKTLIKSAGADFSQIFMMAKRLGLTNREIFYLSENKTWKAVVLNPHIIKTDA